MPSDYEHLKLGFWVDLCSVRKAITANSGLRSWLQDFGIRQQHGSLGLPVTIVEIQKLALKVVKLVVWE